MRYYTTLTAVATKTKPVVDCDNHRFTTIIKSTSTAPTISLPSKEAIFCHTLNIFLVGCQRLRAILRLHLNSSERGRLDSRPAGRLVGWLVGWSAGQLVSWSVGQLVGRLVGWSVGRLVGLSVGRSVGRLAGRSVGWSVGRSVGRSVGWSVGWSVGCWLVGLKKGLPGFGGFSSKRKSCWGHVPLHYQ